MGQSTKRGENMGLPVEKISDRGLQTQIRKIIRIRASWCLALIRSIAKLDKNNPEFFQLSFSLMLKWN